MNPWQTKEPTITFEDRYTKIFIHLKPGIYSFFGDSATGKTWLLKNFKSIFEDTGNAFGYTYSDFLSGTPIDAAKNKNCQVVMFDRYDMYKGAFVEELLELASEKVVLLTCNTIQDLRLTTKFCSIYLPDVNKIIVG